MRCLRLFEQKELQLLLSSSVDSEIIVFDVKQDRNSVVTKLRHPGDISTLTLSASGFFSGSVGGKVCKWGVKNIFDIRMEAESSNSFFCSELDTAFDTSKAGDLIFGVSGEDPTRILIEDLKREKTLVELEGHSREVLTVRHSDKFNKLFSGGADKTVIKWDLNTYRKENVFEDFHSGDIQSLLLVKDDRLLISGSKDKFLSIFETKAGKHVGTVRFDTSVLCIGKDRAEAKIICGGKDTQDLRIWQLDEILKFCQQQVGSLRKINKAAKLSKLKIGDEIPFDDDPLLQTNLKRDRYEFGANFEVMDSMDEVIYEKKINKEKANEETSISNNHAEEPGQVDIHKELDQIYQLLEENKEVIQKESIPTLVSMDLEAREQEEGKEQSLLDRLKEKVKGEREKAKELREDIIKLNEDLLEKFTEIKDEQNGTIEKIVESNIVQFRRDEEVVNKLEELESLAKGEAGKTSYQKRELEFANEILERELGILEKSLQRQNDFLGSTGKKVRKCYALRKKGRTLPSQSSRKREKHFTIKRKYSDYVFNYLKNILVETRKLEEAPASKNSTHNSFGMSASRKLYLSEMYNTNKSNFSDLSVRDPRGSFRSNFGLKDFERTVREMDEEIRSLEMDMKRKEKEHWNLTRDFEKLNERVYRMNKMEQELVEEEKFFAFQKEKMMQEVGNLREGVSKEELVKRLMQICDADSSKY